MLTVYLDDDDVTFLPVSEVTFIPWLIISQFPFC